MTAMTERWWSAPMVGNEGKTVIVTGRDYMETVLESGKFPYLMRVSWRYNAQPDGFPDDTDAELMGRVNDAFEETFRKDKCAYMVAIYTGEGIRDWLFYAHSLTIFNKVFNRALEGIEETVPFKIEAQSDPEWSEYAEMRSLSYIPEDCEEGDTKYPHKA